jgi:hypothetical protein
VPTSKPRPVQIYVALPDRVLDALSMAATREDRPLKAQIRHYVAAGLRRDGFLAEPDKATER